LVLSAGVEGSQPIRSARALKSISDASQGPAGAVGDRISAVLTVS